MRLAIAGAEEILSWLGRGMWRLTLQFKYAPSISPQCNGISGATTLSKPHSSPLKLNICPSLVCNGHYQLSVAWAALDPGLLNVLGVSQHEHKQAR